MPLLSGIAESGLASHGLAAHVFFSLRVPIISPLSDVGTIGSKKRATDVLPLFLPSSRPHSSFSGAISTATGELLVGISLTIMSDEGAYLKTLNNLFRVYTTTGQLAQDRGYVTPPTTIPSSMEEFRQRFETVVGETKTIARDHMTFLCEHRESREQMLIAFNGEDTFTFEHYKKMEEQATKALAKRMIVVIAGKVAATSRSRIEATNRSEFGVKTQLFHEDDLVVNITHHELVPEHTPLTDVELQEVLKAHSLEKQMLPRMLSTDPVALYFGLEKGRVVKISRKSESAGKYVTYRQVV